VGDLSPDVVGTYGFDGNPPDHAPKHHRPAITRIDRAVGVSGCVDHKGSATTSDLSWNLIGQGDH